MELDITCKDWDGYGEGSSVVCKNAVDRESNCSLCSLSNRYTCEEDIKQRPPRLSHSALNKLMICDRMYYWSGIEGLETKATTQMQMGSLWDKILEAYDHVGAAGVFPAHLLNDIKLENLSDYDIAKVKAMYRCFRDLGLSTKHSEQTQHKQVLWLDSETPISVVYDRKGENYFVESKFTSSPKYYDNFWAIQDQVGTYFLADEKMDYCIMEVAEVPQFRPKRATKVREKEEPVDYEQRLVNEILANPTRFFKGYDGQKQRWGLKFYRDEFNLEMIKQRYIKRYQRLKQNINDNWHEMNTTICNAVYGRECDFKDLCEAVVAGGRVDRSRFKIKGKERK